MITAVTVFTRDLRVRDNPALARAVAAADQVVPLFVFDDDLLSRPFACANRVAFLLDCLADLDESLHQRGSALVVRRGTFESEIVAVARRTGAGSVFIAGDVSAYARRRVERLATACRDAGIVLHVTPGVTAHPPGSLRPAAGDHFKVFSPYWNRWRSAARRAVAPTPSRITSPNLPCGARPALSDLVDDTPSPDLARGGETQGRQTLAAWNRRWLESYEERHDDLAGDVTSRVSPYLHFGCISPLEMIERLRERDGAEPYLRQLCWRDFYHQVVHAFPQIASREYRGRGDRWSADERRFEAWRSGRTGYPIVDAGMRQLRREGFMHNRARLITASFLVKDLYVDWRLGARHFLDWLVDGDVANNYGNWQWVAGTGNDTRPNRVFNPLRQAERYDPDGEYVRRYVPELSSIAGKAVHQPWTLEPLLRRRIDYPEPIVDHAEAVAAFRAARSAASPAAIRAAAS